MKRLAVVLLLTLGIWLAPGPDLRAVPVPCDCATCLLSPDRLCTEPEKVRVWRCQDYTAARCPVHPAGS